jgi:hypothetical protein
MKKTEWFPPHIKPVRKGHYECRRPGFPYTLGLDYWNGTFWCEARSKKPFSTSLQNTYEWRGLKEEAK